MSSVDYFRVIHSFLPSESEAYRFYVPHVVQVTQMAIRIGNRLHLSTQQLRFIEEAAMLHDIGIQKVNAPDIGCTGSEPYIRHGILGSDLLQQEGLAKHALVCERHTGVGLSKEEIIEKDLPLPHRDLLPISIEEQIICYADCWFSKDPKKLWTKHSYEAILNWFHRFPGANDKIAKFDRWREQFGE
jgi:uncharacterized protein